MTKHPQYCSACGSKLTRKKIDGRIRDICTACKKIAYRNPIPVAAALVVDKQDRLLLVKRKIEPKRGMWCLPMGFAEINETIQESALRELKEEAGIDGRVISLLDLLSSKSELYGDMLVVTFHIEHTAGVTQAGDDAEEAKWFPLSALPPLAFSSNQKALTAYLKQRN